MCIPSVSGKQTLPFVVDFWPFAHFLACLLFPCSVWEIITRKIPWEGESNEDVQRKVCSGERPPLEEVAGGDILEVRQQQILHDLAVLCWNHNLHLRPHFKAIRERLDAVENE